MAGPHYRAHSIPTRTRNPAHTYARERDQRERPELWPAPTTAHTLPETTRASHDHPSPNHHHSNDQ